MADKNKKELVRKVRAYVQRDFGGDYGAAFEYHATSSSPEPTVDAGELRNLLAAASVGNAMTRGAWVRGIIQRLDRDMDGKISAEEFRESIERGK